AWFENSGKEIWVAGDAAAVRALVPSVDVVLADERSAENWGAGAAELAALNPAAIVTSITPFGGSGPWAGRAASELTLQAAGGEMWFVGNADRPPVPIGGNQAGYQAAAQAVLALLAALHSRERGEGGGDLVDVSAQ